MATVHSVNSSNSFKILQWNPRSLNGKMSELETIAHEYDIFMLCETWERYDLLDKFGEKYRFQVIKQNRQDRGGGGLAFLVREGIDCEEDTTIYHDRESMESMSICVETRSREKILLTLIYRFNNVTTSSHQWKRMFDSVSRYKNVLIGGDFNCHSTFWGSHKTCATAKQLLDTLEDEELFILNDGTPTHLDEARSKLSAIDLSMCSVNMYGNIEWEVKSDRKGSDHYPIAMTLNTNLKIHGTAISHRLKMNKVDWNRFQIIAHNKVEKIKEEGAFEEVNEEDGYELVMSLIRDTVIDLQGGARDGNDRPRTVQEPKLRRVQIKPPWWNDRCTELVKERKAADVPENPKRRKLKKLNSHS